jgi:hypothetical protein
MVTTKGTEGDDDHSENAVDGDTERCAGSNCTNQSVSVAGTTTSNRKEKATASWMIEKGRARDVSPAIHKTAALPPRSPPKKDSLDQTPATCLQLSSGLSSEEPALTFEHNSSKISAHLPSSNEDTLLAGRSPGAVAVQGINTVGSAVNHDTTDDRENGIRRPKMDEERPPSSLIVAAELVQDDKEARDFVPGGKNDIWEQKVQEEVETRLQSLAVAEVITQDEIEIKRRRIMRCLLLTLAALIGGIIAGVVITTGKKGRRRPGVLKLSYCIPSHGTYCPL